MGALHEWAIQGDWVILEFLFRLFPSSRMRRQTWRQACEAIDAAFLAIGHRGLPALIPGLVHARLATALLAVGYRSKRDLQARKFLCLGCHAGLEVRILRDFAAMRALGGEIRQDVVTACLTAGLVGPQDIVAQDFWEYLRLGEHEMFDTVIVLAPQLALAAVVEFVATAVVAGRPATDILSVPHETAIGPAIEGTTSWYRLTCNTEF